MKRILIFLTALICYAVTTFAQEVHGIESKMVCTYDCNPNGTWDGWGKRNYSYEHNPWFSYEFANLNSISVSVEVELYTKPSKEYKDGATPRLMSTKSFVLKQGESYVWKNGEDKGVDLYENHERYFVKYKAYKLL